MFPEIGSESENGIQSTQPVTSLDNNDSISKMHKSSTLSVKDPTRSLSIQDATDVIIQETNQIPELQAAGQ